MPNFELDASVPGKLIRKIPKKKNEAEKEEAQGSQFSVDHFIRHYMNFLFISSRYLSPTTPYVWLADD